MADCTLPELMILYGSETGTAQGVAERIWREAKCMELSAKVLPMDDYEASRLIYEELIIFVCSTTGQGDPPTNMLNFWKFLLRKGLPKTSLQDLRFCVLGLGDSSYVKFNFMAKKLQRRLCSLGGTPLVEIGLADDQHDLGADAVVDPWVKSMWKSFGEIFNVPVVKLEGIAEKIPPARWNVQVVNNAEWESKFEFPVAPSEQLIHLTLLSNERTTAPEHFQDVRLIKFQAPCPIDYQPGNVAMVRPANNRESVDQFLSLLPQSNYSGDTRVKVSQKDPDMPVPDQLRSPVTLSELATSYWDLNECPTRFVFHILSFLTTSDLEREKLQELTSSEGQEELFNYSNRPRRTAVEVLADFPHASANIPLPYLFEIFRPIRPRAFSIASSPTFHSREIHLLVAVVKYQTKLFLPRFGLCSNWLASLSQGCKVSISIRKGSLSFPRVLAEPVIMVGPGTGVAPFRSYIFTSPDVPKNDQKLYLFFGCRNKEGDFHLRDEWNLKEVRLFTAFSRDQEHKIYVQHLIEKEGEVISELLVDRSASIFVAGNAKEMPDAVKEAFADSLVKHRDFSQERAWTFLAEMENCGKYQSETWC